MSGISELAYVASSVSSALFEKLYDPNKFLSKTKYFIRKKLLPKCKCVILDDYSFGKLSLESVDRKYILISPEKIFSLILNDGDRANLRRLKLESYDTYLLVVGRKLKRIVNNMRFLHSKSRFVVVVSSYVLAKKLGFKDKNIQSFIMDDELFNSVVAKARQVDEIAYFHLMREIQKQDINKTSFDSFKQLSNLVITLSENKLTPVSNFSVNKSQEEDEI